jgi:hypothetical protein
MSVNTRVHRLDADQKLIDGVQKHLSQFATLPVGSQAESLSPADIVKILQGRIDAGNAAVKADAARSAAIKAERDERNKTAPIVSSLRRIVVGMYNQSPDTLAAFGLKAPKVAKKKAQVVADAVLKNEATRKARHTQGKRQKQKVKGQLPSTPQKPNP